MNKLELEFDARRRHEVAKQKADSIKDEIDEANEIRTLFPTYKSIGEGDYSNAWFCIFHKNQKFGMNKNNTPLGCIICVHCGAFKKITSNIHNESYVTGFIDPNVENFDFINNER